MNQRVVSLSKEQGQIHAKWLVQVGRIFALAGLKVEEVWEEPGQYCGDDCCPWRSTAVLITREIGTIRISWRKRVMEITWDSDGLGIDGEVLFKEQNVTKGSNYIHCWSEEDAVSILKKLSENRIFKTKLQVN